MSIQYQWFNEKRNENDFSMKYTVYQVMILNALLTGMLVEWHQVTWIQILQTHFPGPDLFQQRQPSN